MQFFAERVDKDAIDRLQRFVTADFAQVDYTDAVTILENCGKQFENPVYWGVDLSSEHERYLAEEHFKAPVVVKNYPKDIKAFYMRLNEDGKTVAAMDVLAPGIGEIIGGSQREERLDVLDARMAEMGLNKEDYWWYRDLRRYGTVPHSGFRSGLRASDRLRDRRAERPRCHSVPADPAQRDILNFSDINLKGQRKLAFFMSITVNKIQQT
jgi:asparaginyl-tRNA synthetase